jgi:hypothetical protein
MGPGEFRNQKVINGNKGYGGRKRCNYKAAFARSGCASFWNELPSTMNLHNQDEHASMIGILRKRDFQALARVMGYFGLRSLQYGHSHCADNFQSALLSASTISLATQHASEHQHTTASDVVRTNEPLPLTDLLVIAAL